MFSTLFSSTLTKILSAVAALGLVSSLFLGWAYLGIRDDLSALKTQHKQLQQELKESEDSKEKARISCELDNKLLFDLRQKLQSVQGSTEKSIKDLQNLPRKSCQPLGVDNASGKDVYVDIDAPFDDDFKRVFKQRNKN